MKQRERAEATAEYILQSKVGLQVNPVPTSTTETPEFQVDGDGRGYLVEVKTRYNSEQWREDIHSGEAALESRSLGWSRWAEDVARKAVSQLAALDPSHERWWILWISVAVEPTGTTAVQEVFGSLFGTRQAAYWDEDGKGRYRDCLYAMPGVFERHPELCACVIDPSGFGPVNIAINEFAPDKESFETSKLYRTAVENHALVTEAGLVERNWMVCDRGLERRDEAVVATHLQEKYGLEKVMILNIQEHSASMFVPHEAKNGPGGEAGNQA